MKLEKELYRYFFVLIAFIAIHWVFGGVLPTFLILKVMLMVYAVYIAVQFIRCGGEVDAWVNKGAAEEIRAPWARVIALLFALCALIFPIGTLIGLEETQVMLAQAISIPVVYGAAMVPMFLGKQK